VLTSNANKVSAQPPKRKRAWPLARALPWQYDSSSHAVRVRIIYDRATRRRGRAAEKKDGWTDRWAGKPPDRIRFTGGVMNLSVFVHSWALLDLHARSASSAACIFSNQLTTGGR